MASTLAELRQASISVAAQAAAFGVIGATIGFWVLALYGVQRNALPEFGGDEWLPQFVKLGFSCGVFVALLTLAPLTDVFLHRAFMIKPGWQSAVRPAEVFKHNRRYASRQGILLISLGLLFSTLVIYGPDLPFWPIGPTGTLVCTLLVGVAAHLVLHNIRQQPSPSNPTERWYEGVFHAALTDLVYLFTLLTLLLLLSERFGVITNRGFLALAVGASIALAILQMFVFLVLQQVRQMTTRLAIAAVIVAIVASILAPEVVRVAGLGNLPNVFLFLERSVACHVATHLELQDRSAACDKSSNGDADARLTVDVVLRAGTQYTIAAPGTLSSRKADACATVHHSATSASSPRDARRFRCVDVPREAVKVTLR